jgi:hypothetical protein
MRRPRERPTVFARGPRGTVDDDDAALDRSHLRPRHRSRPRTAQAEALADRNLQLVGAGGTLE